MHDDGVFDESRAATYDEDSVRMFAPDVIEPTVAFLADLAGDGRALEFAVGTGRVALPLAATGVEVAGIELSQAMVDRLRSKPRGDAMDVTIGDMSEATALGTFSLVYLVYNTINNLLTQELQVACFENAARHLEPGGRFVIEVLVPGLQRLLEGDRYQVFHASDERWGIDEIDVVTQRAVSHHIWISEGRSEHFPFPYRYVWPSELDLMARLAGMRLVERWGDWDRSPFTAESQKHVSVWQKTDS